MCTSHTPRAHTRTSTLVEMHRRLRMHDALHAIHDLAISAVYAARFPPFPFLQHTAQPHSRLVKLGAKRAADDVNSYFANLEKQVCACSMPSIAHALSGTSRPHTRPHRSASPTCALSCIPMA